MTVTKEEVLTGLGLFHPIVPTRALFHLDQPPQALLHLPFDLLFHFRIALPLCLALVLVLSTYGPDDLFPLCLGVLVRIDDQPRA